MESADRGGRVRHTAWKVLIGAPGTGKTTLLRQLASKGYTVVSDPARDILEQDVHRGGEPFSSRQDYREFQWQVLRIALSRMERLPDTDVVYFDYGICECLAFLKAAHISWDRDMVEAVVQIRFAEAYLLELVPQPMLPADSIRIESIERRIELQQLVTQIYSIIGPEPIPLTFSTPDERLAQILLRDQLGLRVRK